MSPVPPPPRYERDESLLKNDPLHNGLKEPLSWVFIIACLLIVPLFAIGSVSPGGTIFLGVLVTLGVVSLIGTFRIRGKKI